MPCTHVFFASLPNTWTRHARLAHAHGQTTVFGRPSWLRPLAWCGLGSHEEAVCRLEKQVKGRRPGSQAHVRGGEVFMPRPASCPRPRVFMPRPASCPRPRVFGGRWRGITAKHCRRCFSVDTVRQTPLAGRCVCSSCPWVSWEPNGRVSLSGLGTLKHSRVHATRTRPQRRQPHAAPGRDMQDFSVCKLVRAGLLPSKSASQQASRQTPARCVCGMPRVASHGRPIVASLPWLLAVVLHGVCECYATETHLGGDPRRRALSRSTTTTTFVHGRVTNSSAPYYPYSHAEALDAPSPLRLRRSDPHGGIRLHAGYPGLHRANGLDRLTAASCHFLHASPWT